MKKQILRIAPHQSAKVIAVLYILLTLPFALIGIIGMVFGSPESFLFLALSPIIYGVFGYIFCALFFWLYNIVANRIGGIEFETKNSPDA